MLSKIVDRNSGTVASMKEPRAAPSNLQNELTSADMETGIPVQGSGCAKTLVSVAIMVSYAKVRAHSKLEVSTESYVGNFCSSAIK